MHAALGLILRWYFDKVFAVSEGVGCLPFYCDQRCVGSFAVEPSDLAVGADAALLRLFVALSMYQGRRDVLVMRQQRAMRAATVDVLADRTTIARNVTSHPCCALNSFDAFTRDCDVNKVADYVDCKRARGAACHVKDSTVAFRRMGDMGKLPTSAWLLTRDGFTPLLDDVCAIERSPYRRAVLLVGRLSGIYRVGRKLATLFVSALATPALAPGLTPWYPRIDGNGLTVVDTNVGRAVDVLRRRRAGATYAARDRWLRTTASRIDLRIYHPDVPSYSPRILQQALYAFGSKSNRVARGDACRNRATPCGDCATPICPFRSP